MEFLPKFSAADRAWLQTCRRLLDFYVILCYYEYRNAQVRSRKLLTVCAPESNTAAKMSGLVQRGKVPPAALPCTCHAADRYADDPYTSAERQRGASCRRRAVRIQRKHFPHQPGESRRRMQQRPQIGTEVSRARMEPAHSYSIGLSKNAPYAAVSRLRSPAGTAVRKLP